MLNRLRRCYNIAKAATLFGRSLYNYKECSIIGERDEGDR